MRHSVDGLRVYIHICISFLSKLQVVGAWLRCCQDAPSASFLVCNLCQSHIKMRMPTPQDQDPVAAFSVQGNPRRAALALTFGRLSDHPTSHFCAFLPSVSPARRLSLSTPALGDTAKFPMAGINGECNMCAGKWRRCGCLRAPVGWTRRGLQRARIIGNTFCC